MPWSWRRERPLRTTLPTNSIEHHETEAEAVASLTARRLAALPADSRPLPSVAAYDALLRNPRKDTATP